MTDKHSLHSSEREEYIEYIFLAEMCSIGWQRDRLIEIARSGTDAFGYDVILSCGDATRHVQLKASKADSKTATQKISLRLSEKPSGCVIWILIDPDTLRPASYLWFGAGPGAPLPDPGEKIAKHTKGDSDGTKAARPGHRELGKGKFTPVTSSSDLFDLMFGPH